MILIKMYDYWFNIESNIREVIESINNELDLYDNTNIYTGTDLQYAIEIQAEPQELYKILVYLAYRYPYLVIK